MRECLDVRARAREQSNTDVEFQHPRRGAARHGNGLVERMKSGPETSNKVYVGEHWGS